MINVGWGQHIDFHYVAVGCRHALCTHLMNCLCFKDVFGPSKHMCVTLAFSYEFLRRIDKNCSQIPEQAKMGMETVLLGSVFAFVEDFI